MREIKFRAWHFESGNPLYKPYMQYSSDTFDMPLFWRHVADEPCQVEVMQYTGLKDKNGVEIFEGDIYAVKLYPGYTQRVHWRGDNDAIGVVFWDYSGFRLKVAGKDDRRFCDFIDICDEESRIIGNIYENPELLEQS